MSAADRPKPGPGARLRGAQLSGVDYRELDLRGADLRSAQLDGSKLDGATLDDADLTCANLRGASLAGVSAQRAVIESLELQGANFSQADLSEASLAAGRLHGASLAGATLSGADLRGAELKDADLSGARLDGAQLHAVLLAGAQLRDADLTGADLSHADLRGADLRGARLDGALFEAAELEGVSLADSSLRGTRLWSTYGLDADARRDAEARGASLYAPLHGLIMRGWGYLAQRFWLRLALTIALIVGGAATVRYLRSPARWDHEALTLEAERRSAAGKIHEANALYRRALDMLQSRPRFAANAAVPLALNLMSLGEADAAESLLQALPSAALPPWERSQVGLVRGQIRLDARDFDGAIARWTPLLELPLPPEEAQSLRATLKERVEVAMQQGESAAGTAFLERVQAPAPEAPANPEENAEAFQSALGAARKAAQSGRHDEATAALQKIAGDAQWSQQRRAEARFELANVYESQGRRDEAIAALKQNLDALAPKDDAAPSDDWLLSRVMLLDLEAESRDVAGDATALLERIGARGSWPLLVRAALGRAHARAGRTTEAQATLEVVLRQAGADASERFAALQAALELGPLYRQSRGVEAEIALYEETLKTRAPTPAQAATLRARIDAARADAKPQ